MILTTTFAAEHIQRTAGSIGKGTDPKILEKALQAFYLLEQLQHQGLQFTFKGGTSLLLLLDPPRRFSIDIDIITDEGDRIEPILDRIVSDSHFLSWEPDNDRKHKSDAPIAHYKIFYRSAISQHFGPEPILLDVLLTANPYPLLHQREIKHPWLLMGANPLSVSVPTIESIIGDKLTAFAPTTTGILYSKKRPVEIIKQLFDVGTLFDEITDYDSIVLAYDRMVREEIGFRKLNADKRAVLMDTFNACLSITMREAASEDFRTLQMGINNITNFILTRFKIEEAITASAKVATLVTWLMRDREGVYPIRYTEPKQLVDVVIKDPAFTKLSKLKKSNPEAFFYWAQAVDLVNRH